jgi:hypothetical protein
MGPSGLTWSKSVLSETQVLLFIQEELDKELSSIADELEDDTGSTKGGGGRLLVWLHLSSSPVDNFSGRYHIPSVKSRSKTN